MMAIELLFAGFISAIGWWGANYYVITPYLPEPIYAEKRAVEEKKTEQPVLDKIN
jgi:hypothetical protein